MRTLDLGFTVIWDLGFHQRVFLTFYCGDSQCICPDVRQISWLLIVSDFRI
jgi:hypothetical protein